MRSDLDDVERSIRHFGSLERQTRSLVFSEVFSCGVADGGASFFAHGRRRAKRLCIPFYTPAITIPFPGQLSRADDFIGYPTAIEITWLRAHALAIE